MENRNKENLEIFKGDIQNLAQSADEIYKGSYRYQDPTYIFLKEIDEKMTAVIVNATDGEYITSINPTKGQIEDLKKTIPRDKVIEFEITNAKSLSTENIPPVPRYTQSE